MVLYNYQDREITGKIVYFGPQAVGKSTSLKHIYDRVDEEARGALLQDADEGEARLSFEFLPVNVGEITGMRIRFQLVTAPGAESSEPAWRRLLQGADAIVFVADSDPDGLQGNRESYEFLMEQLESCGVDAERIPLVFQLNKRDVATAVDVERINHELNLRRVPWFASSALNGEGVLETFQTIGRMLLVDIGRRYKEELLRKKREGGARKTPATVAAGTESAEPDEETRAIKMKSSAVAAALHAEPPDEAPTRLVEPGELDDTEAESVTTGGQQDEDRAAGTSRGAAKGRADRTRKQAAAEGSDNGRGAAREEDAGKPDDDEPTAADLRVSSLEGAPERSGGSGRAAEIRALGTELTQLSDQSVRLLEQATKLLRRVEDLRQRIERLGE